MNYKILITTIATCVFGIIVASLWAGIQMREVTVVEHPYEEGLRYDSTQKKYQDLGWKVVVPPSLKPGGQLQVLIYDKNGAPLDVSQVELAVNRINSTDIKKYRAARADRGRYDAQVDFSSKGLWEIRVNLTQGADTLSYDNQIHIDG